MMSNHQIFLMLVQTALLAAQNSKSCSATRVYEAFSEATFIPASAIPLGKLELMAMVKQFIDYQVNDKIRPDWYLAEWVPNGW